MNNYPTGLMGRIAEYIRSQSVSPVDEIAIAGAIGLISGVVGRSYNISGTGLNQYTILLAPTGTGKGAMRIGIGRLISAAKKINPDVGQFMGPSRIQSSNAILKHMQMGKKSLVSILGEFGDELKAMSTDNPLNKFFGLSHFLRMIYEMSANGLSIEPDTYSDKRKFSQPIESPSFSLLCESTPESFHESLTSKIVLNGLLSRFTIIEYNGDAPQLNEKPAALPESLVKEFASLCANSASLNTHDTVINVTMDADAAEIASSIAAIQNENVNSSTREITRHLWSRYHLKTLKLAALVAVGEDQIHPHITKVSIRWAMEIVRNDIERMVDKFQINTGSSELENVQLQKLMLAIKKFTTLPFKKFEKLLPNTRKLHGDQIFPLAYAQKTLVSTAPFKKSLGGSRVALHNTVKRMVELGYIERIDEHEIKTQYGYNGWCFSITNREIFEEINLKEINPRYKSLN